jgi:hypothetical protein
MSSTTTDAYNVEFNKGVNFLYCETDLEKFMTAVSEKLAIDMTEKEYPALIITGSNPNTTGLHAYDSEYLTPGFRLRFGHNTNTSIIPDLNESTSGLINGNGLFDLNVTVNAYTDNVPKTIVRRDNKGGFAANTIVANQLVLSTPDIRLSTNKDSYGEYTSPNIFNSDGSLNISTTGTSDNAKNVTTSIAGIAINKILAQDSNGNNISDVKSALNVSNTIRNVNIVAPNNLDASKGILQMGSNADGSDTYAKRALYALKADSLVINDIPVDANDFARCSVANTFAGVNTFNSSIISSSSGKITVESEIEIKKYLSFVSANTSVPTTGNTAAFYMGSNNPTAGNANRLNYNGHFYATKIYNAAYNDLAECFIPEDGLTYNEMKNKIVQINPNGKIEIAKSNSKNIIGIVSDNYGCLLGGSEKDILENKKIPVGLSGTLYVNASFDFDYAEIGNFITSDSEGNARIANIEYDANAIVGKIIHIDNENKRYKVILLLK